MSELTQAILHFEQGRVSSDKVCEEIADVLIIVNQLAWYHGEDRITEIANFKLDRLKNRLKE